MIKKILLILAYSTILIAQKTIEVNRANTIPIIDGIVIEDAAWTDIKAISDFTQKTPDEGFAEVEDEDYDIIRSIRKNVSGK